MSCPQAQGAAKSVEPLLAAAKAAVAAQAWPLAEACAADAVRLAPQDRDAAFMQVRIQAWQGRHAEAARLIAPWPAKDLESRALRGDLAWYAGSFAEAASWYEAAVATPAPASVWASLVKAQLAAKNAAAAANALTRGLVAHPGAAELEALRPQVVAVKPAAKAPLPPSKPASAKPLPPKPAAPPTPVEPGVILRTAAAATLIHETQGQSAQAFAVDASATRNRKTLAIGAGLARRDYGRTTLTDTPLSLALGYGTPSRPAAIESHETTLTVGGSPRADFVPSRLARLRYELHLRGEASLFAELGAISYSDTFVRAAAVGSSQVFGKLHFDERLNAARDTAWTASGALTLSWHSLAGGHLIPAAFAAAGRDAASRPYLARSADAPFRSFGVRLTAEVSAFTVFAGAEQRQEEGFRQLAATLGAAWKN